MIKALKLMKPLLVSSVLFLSVVAAFAQSQSTDVAGQTASRDSSLQLREDNIPQIVAAMTPEEKCMLIIGGRAASFNGIGFTNTGVPGAAGVINGIPRLGIPTIVLADGPAGLRISPVREGDSRTFYCTGYPIATMLSSTWNLELVQEAGRNLGNEVLEYGVDILLAPGANIHRNPLCGRNFEYYSEDPLLSGKMAAAMINGIEENGVGTSLKHFAVNNQEFNRLSNDAIVSERALREIYLRNFEIAVRESQPWTVMTSYNFINGEHAAESKRLLTDILRDEWGFEGAVMTDWNGGYDDPAIIRAGNEMIQPGRDERYVRLLNAVKDGSLSMAVVDRTVTRILELVIRTPKFKGYAPSENPDLKAHAQVCKKVADEGVVLLKNDLEALPMSKDNKIALFGVTSYDFIAGGTGSGNVNRSYVVDLMRGLSNVGFRLEPELDAFYKEYMRAEALRCERINGDNKWYIDRERAIEVIPDDLIGKSASNSDVAVITIGRVFGEGKDRDYYHSYLLSDREKELISKVSEAFHAAGKKVTVILNTGGFVEMTSWQDKVDAVVLCWQPGQEGGNTVASVLSGEVNPSGHLPATISTDYALEPTAMNFPQVYADKPFNYSYYRQLTDRKLPVHTVRNIDYTMYEEGIYVGYRYFNTFAPKAVAYPFGFGLSYTSFDFKDMHVERTDDGWNVFVTVTNTGKVSGKDVVQLYVKAPKGKLDKPERELKGFAKTPEIAPGKSCTVTVHVPEASLASYDELSSNWIVDAGKYVFMASQDASDCSLKKTVRVEGSVSPVEGDGLKVISYNIRVGKGKDGSNSWEHRRHASITMLKEQMPDIFGLQEALDFQVSYLQENLPGYKNVGVGRDDGVAKGERMSIFYNTNTVELFDWGTFWLSETPEIPSKGWDAAYPRCATWAKMKMKDSGKEFFYVNTHLDHQGAESQQKGLDLIVRRVAAMNPAGLPMVLTGDFNVEPDNPVLDELDTRMLSAQKSALEHDVKATFNGWGSRAIVIDYIYFSGFSHCPEYKVLDGTYDSVPYISDHYPVMSRLKFL